MQSAKIETIRRFPKTGILPHRCDSNENGLMAAIR